MADTAQASIFVNEVVYGGPGEVKQGTIGRGIPVGGAHFVEVPSGDPKSADNVNAKIIYPDNPGIQPIYVEDTVSTLVSKANGNTAASI